MYCMTELVESKFEKKADGSLIEKFVKKSFIEGVKVKTLKRWFDASGDLTEIIKEGEETFINVKQSNHTVCSHGIIKAFHYHKKQTDVWYCPIGLIQVILYDARKESKSFGQTNVFFLGERNPLVLLIPKGVAHGYRVLSEKPAHLIYFTDQAYNASDPDEIRIPFDDKKIGFDWTIKNG